MGDMSIWSTARTIGAALGIVERHVEPIGCAVGKAVFRETKRATQIVNVRRRPRPLAPAAAAALAPWFPDLDLSTVRIRTSCRLPPNRFDTEGHIYAMTFGSTIYWRDQFDEGDPKELVRLAHELVHVDQVRRYGGESSFACAYGRGYVEGGGALPAYFDDVGAYHRNPLEAEAYRFEAQFRDERGRVVPDSIRTPSSEPEPDEPSRHGPR